MFRIFLFTATVTKQLSVQWAKTTPLCIPKKSGSMAFFNSQKDIPGSLHWDIEKLIAFIKH